MTNVSVAWLSLDPVRQQIDYYPRAIATRIEQKYNQRCSYERTIPTNIVLGSDFFNATIHFHHRNGCYQTTPGINLGRNGMKQPGMRSVKRIQLTSDMTHLEIHAKRYHGEWRITNHPHLAERTFNVPIPSHVVVDGTEEINESNTFWKPEDLNNDDKFVVVWQWCRGVPERQGNLMVLSDEWWLPYLQHQNQIIETAYGEYEQHVDITLATDNSSRRIKFNENNCFGTQLDIINHKSRCVRRLVITIAKLKEKLEAINNQPLEPAILSTLVETDEIPHEYFCCISQEVMIDPVKTTDNHTYDRSSIERWFQTRHTSPLTGLELLDITLTPHTELKNQIQEYIRLKSNEQTQSNEEILQIT
jgi:hypothetical protein|tara:strand:- start:880 stop:1962 length:1083 start_codon:yes stop_codon:yes gene_type:complete